MFRRDDVPDELRICHFIGAVRYLGVWYRPGGPIPADAVARHYADLLLGGLR